jgi:hypothetical protein
MARTKVNREAGRKAAGGWRDGGRGHGGGKRHQNEGRDQRTVLEVRGRGGRALVYIHAYLARVRRVVPGPLASAATQRAQRESTTQSTQGTPLPTGLQCKEEQRTQKKRIPSLPSDLFCLLSFLLCIRFLFLSDIMRGCLLRSSS